MKAVTTICFSLLIASIGNAFAQKANQPDSVSFTYTEKKVGDQYHYFLEGPTSYKFISRQKFKNPKMVKDFDFLEGDMKLNYVQSKAAFMIKASGDTLASIVFKTDWFDIIMPDGRLYNFKWAGKYQWEYWLNGQKVYEGRYIDRKGKKVIWWTMTETEPEAVLALSNVGAAYSGTTVPRGLSPTAVVVAVIVGVILTLARA